MDEEKYIKSRLSTLFHNHSKTRPALPASGAEWPTEWSTVYCKTYPRFKEVMLEKGKFSFDLREALLRRESKKKKSTDSPLSYSQISALITHAAGKSGLSGRRTYPSAGKRYPIELYILILHKTDVLGRGLYHFNVESNALTNIGLDLEVAKFLECFGDRWFSQSDMIVFMSGVFWRSQHKYGERGYRFILLEAGCLLQNFYLVSEALGINCCAVGSVGTTNDSELERVLDIDGVSESLVGMVAFSGGG